MSLEKRPAAFMQAFFKKSSKIHLTGETNRSGTFRAKCLAQMSTR